MQLSEMLNLERMVFLASHNREENFNGVCSPLRSIVTHFCFPENRTIIEYVVCKHVYRIRIHQSISR